MDGRPPDSARQRTAHLVRNSPRRDSPAGEKRLTAAELIALIASGESQRVESKKTARWNVHTQQRDASLEHVIAKAIAFAGFLNADRA